MTEPLRVLLVDDEPETLRLVRKILQSDGHTVVEAVDGQEALDLFHKERPDLILLDIIIPQIDGIEVLKRIRAEDPVTGIIMVSALTSEKLAVEAMLNGADDYVSKPFPLKEIRVRINQAAGKAKLRRENQKLQRQLAAVEQRLHYGASAAPRIEPAPVEVTILTADLYDIVQAMQSLPAERQIESLNRSLNLVTEAVQQHGSILHNVAGNLIMAVFANGEQQHSSQSAAQAALRIRAAMAVHPGNGRPLPVPIRLSIHTGTALLAHIGQPPHAVFTAVGEAVRFSWRLIEQARPGDILLSQESYGHLQERMQAEVAGDLGPLAEAANPIAVYRLIGPSTSAG